jgi:hypothetical protein
VDRASTDLGSSSAWSSSTTGAGVLSSDSTVNADFYNWTKAIVKYCDGASFSGDVGAAVEYDSTLLYFRGERVLQAVLSDLQDTWALDQASEVIVHGWSAGGLTAMLHVDEIAALIKANSKANDEVTVVGYFDAGFFLDHEDIYGDDIWVRVVLRIRCICINTCIRASDNFEF